MAEGHFVLTLGDTDSKVSGNTCSASPAIEDTHRDCQREDADEVVHSATEVRTPLLKTALNRVICNWTLGD